MVLVTRSQQWVAAAGVLTVDVIQMLLGGIVVWLIVEHISYIQKTLKP